MIYRCDQDLKKSHCIKTRLTYILTFILLTYNKGILIRHIKLKKLLSCLRIVGMKYKCLPPVLAHFYRHHATCNSVTRNTT